MAEDARTGTGSSLKVARAAKHLADLRSAGQRFLDSQPYEIAIVDEETTGDRVYKLRAKADPPPELSLIIGDAIHNMRSALDLSICELVTNNGGKVTTTTGFPISTSSDALEDFGIEKAKGVEK